MIKGAVLAVLLGCGVALANEPQVIKETGKDHFETAFSSGGSLRLELRSGEVLISGTDSDKVSISYGGDKADEARDVQIRFSRGSNSGTLRVSGGPRNNFKIRIEIPRTTDLHIRMPFGDLEVEKVQGSKNVELHAGEVSIDVGDPKDYRYMEASVTAGSIESGALGLSKGGLFRSFRRDGPGKYTLHAHVGSGELDLR